MTCVRAPTLPVLPDGHYAQKAVSLNGFTSSSSKAKLFRKCCSLPYLEEDTNREIVLHD